jgi:RNA polymerase sigma-70 factor (ECF subfamily)
MPESQDMLSPDDAQLVNQARTGDAEAYGQLYERYAPMVFRFLFAQLPDRLDAEDLTTEIFIRAWRSLPRYRERGHPFSAYLFRIARNLLSDYRRSTARMETLTEHHARSLPDPGAPLDEAISARMERQSLQETLSRLREDYRTVLVLRFISGLTPEETAGAMGRSQGAVRVLQHRALKALKDSFPDQDRLG